MAQISRPVERGEKRRWDSVANEDCLGRDCLNLHLVQSAGGDRVGVSLDGIRCRNRTRS